MAHEFERRFALAVDRNPDVLPNGAVGKLTVGHEEACRYTVSKKGQCNCDPDIVVHAKGSLYSIDRHGSLIRCS